MSAELFTVPESEWRHRTCRVCGGPLSVEAAATYAAQRQGWVKIGASSNPAERIAVLGMPSLGCQVRAPEGMDWAEPILLLGVLLGDHEHALHQRFAHCHAHGEWFLPDQGMRTWLAGPDLLTLAQAGLPTRRVSKPWTPAPPPPAPPWTQQLLAD